MKKSILVTGVAGSGKSSVSKKLNDLGYKAYDIEEMDGLFKIVNKNTGEVYEDFENNDLEKVKNMDWNCDLKKLQEIIENETSEIAFYCGTASNWEDLIGLFDKIILLKASPEVIERRLSTRSVKDFGGTKEVRDWALEWKDWLENEKEKKGAIVIDGNGYPEEVARNIIKVAASKKLDD